MSIEMTLCRRGEKSLDGEPARLARPFIAGELSPRGSPVRRQTTPLENRSSRRDGPAIYSIVDDEPAAVREALERINKHAFPLEDARAIDAYGSHSGVFKILIINCEWIPSRITVVFVDEALGF